MIAKICSSQLYRAKDINSEDVTRVFFSVSSQQKKLVKKLTYVSNAQVITDLYIKIKSPVENQTKTEAVNRVQRSFTLNKDSSFIDSTTNLIKNTIDANKSATKKLSPVRSKRKHKKKPLTRAKNTSIRHELLIKAICRYFLFYRKKNHHEILDILL
ncbi:hypothetical protein [Yersinia enterocolitica]|uniref:hypothetical protein n=1 Tax=Yersinia enterocolitica TaxID=630 RepID=UPI0006830360|nr:hypothetical protein [Yersinia enterocolitica]